MNEMDWERPQKIGEGFADVWCNDADVWFENSSMDLTQPALGPSDA